MNRVKFGRYQFDLGALQLTHNGKTVALRSKQAELLRVLVEERHQVLSKRELIQRVWRSEFVPDQNLFQAISELRATLAPMTPIKTFTSRGYQWVEPISKVSSYSLAQAAAVLAVCVLSAGLFFQSAEQLEVNSPDDSISDLLPPALSAFSIGLAKMNAHDIVEAEYYFRVSLEENPQFTEARLMHLETLLLSGLTVEARAGAMALIESLTDRHDAYSLIAAMDIISRSNQQAGQFSEALSWATRAADRAWDEGYACTAVVLNARVENLLREHPEDGQFTSPLLAVKLEEAPAHCEDMRSPVPQSFDWEQQGAKDTAVVAQASPLLNQKLKAV